jgi:hypothetical protein
MVMGNEVNVDERVDDVLSLQVRRIYNWKH